MCTRVLDVCGDVSLTKALFTVGWVLQISRMLVSGRDAVHQVVEKVHAVAVWPEVATCPLVYQHHCTALSVRDICIVLKFMAKRDQMEQDSLQPSSGEPGPRT